jgi:hypothetical protein
MIVFDYLTSNFIKQVLNQNFWILNELIETSSNGVLTINNENKKTIEIMYRKDDGSVLIPYDNMSEGLKILSNNLLMSSIHWLQTQLGKGIDFVVVDEISAVSPKNQKLLVKSLLSLEWNKIVTLTSDIPHLSITTLEEKFWINSEIPTIDDKNKINSDITKESLKEINSPEPKTITKRWRKPKNPLQ